MPDSIYAPPGADIDTPIEREHDYYVVSSMKFYLLATLTFNAYFVYWFYRNWRLIKERKQNDTWPPMRGLFYIFFTHSLLVDVDETIKTQGKDYQWSPSAMATLFVILTIGKSVLDQVASSDLTSPALVVISVGLVPILPLIMLPGQRAINVACGDPAGKSNANYTLANWLWLVLGGFIWALNLLGLYLIFAAPEWLVE